MLRDTCWEEGSVAIHDLWSRDLQWSNFLPTALVGTTASSEMNLYVHLNGRQVLLKHWFLSNKTHRLTSRRTIFVLEAYVLSFNSNSFYLFVFYGSA
jgi:hypothetical protein